MVGPDNISRELILGIVTSPIRLILVFVKAFIEVAVLYKATVFLTNFFEEWRLSTTIPQTAFDAVNSDGTMPVLVLSILLIYGPCWSIPSSWIKEPEPIMNGLIRLRSWLGHL